jgi:hypothetical protein
MYLRYMLPHWEAGCSRHMTVHLGIYVTKKNQRNGNHWRTESRKNFSSCNPKALCSFPLLCLLEKNKKKKMTLQNNNGLNSWLLNPHSYELPQGSRRDDPDFKLETSLQLIQLELGSFSEKEG